MCLHWHRLLCAHGRATAFVAPAAVFCMCHDGIPTSFLACTRAKSVAIFTAAAAVYWSAVQLEAEPLLACVTAGLVVANRRLVASS